MAKKFGMESASYEETLAMLEGRGLQIASPYRRILAYGIDVAITYLVSYFLMAKSSFGHLAFDELTGGDPAKYIYLFWAWAALPLYYAICVSMIRRTIGCWISGIAVIMVTGKRINFIYGFLRGFAMGTITALFFPILIILITILVLISFRTDPLRTVGWDMASRSIVVQNGKPGDRARILRT